MRKPDADHPITVTPFSKRVRVLIDQTVVADTKHALVLRESTYPEVYYILREDVDMDLLTKTDRVTHCPYKGDASYFTIAGDARHGDKLANVVWSYEQPFSAVSDIAGHFAFYPNKVKIAVG